MVAGYVCVVQYGGCGVFGRVWVCVGEGVGLRYGIWGMSLGLPLHTPPHPLWCTALSSSSSNNNREVLRALMTPLKRNLPAMHSSGTHGERKQGHASLVPLCGTPGSSCAAPRTWLELCAAGGGPCNGVRGLAPLPAMQLPGLGQGGREHGRATWVYALHHMGLPTTPG